MSYDDPPIHPPLIASLVAKVNALQGEVEELRRRVDVQTRYSRHALPHVSAHSKWSQDRYRAIVSGIVRNWWEVRGK